MLGQVISMIKHNCITAFKDNGGFTLVELTVVLIIIAILAAVVGPGLLGYIDKAKENETLNNAKKVYMAAQTLSDQAHDDLVDPKTRITAIKMSSITLLDFDEDNKPYNIRYQKNWNSDNPTDSMYAIGEFTYDEGGFRAKYTSIDGKWEVTEISTGTN